MGLKSKTALSAVTVALVSVVGTAQAAFQGRDATFAPSTSCTVSGPAKCTYFYDTSLDITILNNWNIGRGNWNASAASGSAQALAATAGFNASGLTGWVLPTGEWNSAPGAQNQFLSIWISVDSTFAGLSGQFDGAQSDAYWSSSVYSQSPNLAFLFITNVGDPTVEIQSNSWYAVAVRPGDVAAIPEPQTYAMLLLGIGGLMFAVRRRTR